MAVTNHNGACGAWDLVAWCPVPLTDVLADSYQRPLLPSDFYCKGLR